MDIKLAQDLARIYQEPIFLVFLDLPKDYDNLDGGCIIQILERYGAGPKMRGIMS